MKTAFIFSGQGSQNPGMGKELYGNFECVKKIFDEADKNFDFSLTELCFNENELINETKYAQPAILTMSTACFKLMEEAGIKADYMAGLSLGEYSALVCAKALDFSEAVKLVHKRGTFMEEACPQGFGGMSAVMNLSEELTLAACKEASDGEKNVYVANFNAPGQIVISGEFSALEKAEQICTEKGAKRVIRLNVSGPFHTPYLEAAAKKLDRALEDLTISAMDVPVITNVSASPIENEGKIRETLNQQIVSSVKWAETVEYLIAQGVERFIELGPGKTLCSFVKKVSKEVETYNIEDLKSYEKFTSKMS